MIGIHYLIQQSRDAGYLPEYIEEDENIMDFLPVFFRTVKNVKLTKEELLKLVEDLKKQ